MFNRLVRDKSIVFFLKTIGWTDYEVLSLFQMNRKSLGTHGEELAAKMIADKGYTILHRNFRCRFGEIDIVASDGDAVIFIEVKTRSNKKFGEAEEAVDLRKQKKIRQVAEYYLMQNHGLSQKCRFDVYSVYLDDNKNPGEIRVNENCF